MTAAPTLCLTAADVSALLTLPDCILAVEAAFAAHARGQSLAPTIAHVDAPQGEFHLKAGGLFVGGRPMFCLKCNGGFFHNPERHNLPAIRGLILLCDGDNGAPLAVMESGVITRLRTGAATAVAAKYLARPDSRTVTVCGTGRQARIQLQALCEVLPIAQVFVHSRNPARAAQFAEEISAALQVTVNPAPDLSAATRKSDVVVTCTPARGAFLFRDMVVPGTFIAAVGADSPAKQELEPALVAACAVVTDLTEQAAHVGELHHAVAAGLMTRAEVRGELGEVVIGQKRGRKFPGEITLFDSTGTALQDAAAAVCVYQRARDAGRGQEVEFLK
ncbi:MAG: ornithine cyclodeaminase [Verrucomicrobia bacterium]|nr:ornithine cyclodeaminase [Verrucomicrobiota bacterium]